MRLRNRRGTRSGRARRHQGRSRYRARQDVDALLSGLGMLKVSAMDILSIVGLVLALIAILVGAVLKGAGIMALVSAAAFMIVVVGTIAAICMQTPLPVMKHAMTILPWVIQAAAAATARS